MNDLYLEQCGCALAVACDLLRQRLIDIMKRFHKRIVVRALFRDFRVFRLTVCQHKQRIVRRGIAVYGNHVEGILHVSAQCFLQKLFGDIHIRCHKCEHCAHIRMNHAGAFAHAADGYFFSTNRHLYCNLLVAGIRCHNRLRRIGSCFFSGLDRLCQHTHTFGHFFHRKLHTDDAGRTNQDALRRNLQRICCGSCRLPAIFIAELSGTRICDTGVYNDRLSFPLALYDFLIP